jgi:hypothetical protein
MLILRTFTDMCTAEIFATVRHSTPERVPYCIATSAKSRCDAGIFAVSQSQGNQGKDGNDG